MTIYYMDSAVHGRVAWRRDRVMELTRDGRSARDIAEILGITERSVLRHRRAAGLSREPGTPMTADELRRAEALLNDGCSLQEVARTLGRSARTIKRRFPGRAWTRAQIDEHLSMIRRFKALEARKELV